MDFDAEGLCRWKRLSLRRGAPAPTRSARGASPVAEIERVLDEVAEQRLLGGPLRLQRFADKHYGRDRALVGRRTSWDRVSPREQVEKIDSEKGSAQSRRRAHVKEAERSTTSCGRVPGRLRDEHDDAALAREPAGDAAVHLVGQLALPAWLDARDQPVNALAQVREQPIEAPASSSTRGGMEEIIKEGPGDPGL